MTRIIAHRGYAGKYPENTLLAFKEAAKFPIYGLELDVHLSKDKIPVICHDERIDRTSNGSGWIKDMTLDQLKSYQFNQTFPQYHEDVALPSLEEFLIWFQDQAPLIVNIELKTNIIDYPGLNQAVNQLIQDYQVEDRVLISSFNHHSIQDFQTINSDLDFAFLTGCSLLNPGRYCQAYQGTAYHPHYLGLRPEDLEDCHQAGIAINPYTPDDPQAMKKLEAMGVSAIITNQVELALDVLA